MPDYDAIVIGAGNGGLSAAAGLARRGIRTLLCERHNVPGGCATSFIRGRFEFEVALHQLSGLGTPDKPGPLRGLLQQIGVIDQIDFVEEDTLYRTGIPGVFDVTLKADRSEIVHALKEKFPSEKKAIENFIGLVWEFCHQLISIYYFRDQHASKDRYPLYFKYALKTGGQVLDEFFEDPCLKMAIASYWGYVGLPPSRISFSDLAMLLWAYTEFKPYHMKGGSQALSNAIVDSFLKAGGNVRFNCGVKKIIVSGGKAVGVITEYGDEIRARSVISNASTISTYTDLIDPETVSPAMLKKLASRTLGPSAVSVYCGLDCEPGDLGIEVSTRFISLNTDMDRQFALCRTFDSPEMCGLTCYDVADPEFSPAGACQVVLISLQYADHWYQIPPMQYADTKYRFAKGLLDIAELVHPGFKDSIEEVEVSTPLTHLRYLGHPGGSFYGFDQYAKDSNLFVSPLSPVQGLYSAGAWVGMGGFQPALESGAAAAKAVCRYLEE